MTPKGRQITTNCHHASACSVATMGSRAARADGGCRRPGYARQVDYPSRAPRRVAVGLSERPRAEPGRLLRADDLARRHRLQAAPAVAPAGERSLRPDGRAGGLQPALPRPPLALRSRGGADARTRVPAVRDLGDRGRDGGPDYNPG